MKDIIGVSYYFGEREYNDAPFRGEKEVEGRAVVKAFKEWLEARYEVEVHTWDCVDARSDDVKAVLYFDYSWRYARKDPFLKNIPFRKRALVLIEPKNINPSLYYLSRYRNLFNTVFTWDRHLLKKHPAYRRINVPVGAEPSAYRENRFSALPFSEKKLLVAMSRNRWSYMPQSTYRLRKKAYAFFDKRFPGAFDLYGPGWNEPAVWYEKWLGHPHYQAYKGICEGGWDEKVACMAKYRFALCMENNLSQPGYISEKILDCFCARCVPVYYGSEGTEASIPKACWIDGRSFSSFEKLADCLRTMPEAVHRGYLEAIDAFMHAQALSFFSTENLFRSIASGLHLKSK